MLPDPVGDRNQGHPKGAAQARKLIVDARRDGGMDSARDQAVALQLAQRERQHALRDIADRTAYFIEAHRTTGEEFHDQHRPLVADPRKGLADRPALLLGLLFVARCQKSASLCEFFQVTILASVTKGNQTPAVTTTPGRAARIVNMAIISVIVGSTREGRFSEKPAKWIFQHLGKRDRIQPRLLDLRDYPMPFFDQAATPAMPGRPKYKHEVVDRWTAAISQSDAFVFVTPEYNYGTSAVLKNAIDWVYPEWHRKPAAFVSYGSVMGARAVQQLRETMIEIQVAPIRSSVHIPVATLWAHYTGGDVDAGLAGLEAPATAMIEDLLWWTAALKAARDRSS